MNIGDRGFTGSTGPRGLMGKEGHLPSAVFNFMSTIPISSAPQLLIFDDCLSAVDTQTEEKILNKMNGIDFFNVGTGKGTSVLELVKIFEEVNQTILNKYIKIKREGDLAITFADCAKITEKTGWKHKQTLENACKLTNST
jgi:nucleoside-diphosphate-sugar epimerase